MEQKTHSSDPLNSLLGLECLNCALNQVTATTELLGMEMPRRKALMQQAVELIARKGVDRNNCELIEEVYRIVTRAAGDEDPYRDVKAHFNRGMLRLCPEVRRHIQESGDPLRAAVRAAIAGNLLSIKPILRVRDGVLDVIAKARGTRQANLQLMKEIENAGGADFSMPYMLGFTGMEDTLLKKFIESSASYWPDASVPYADIGSVVGTHAGPGAYAAAFFVR